MFRTTVVRAAAAAALVVALAPWPLAAAPVRLARHPDYHAGKITFSYLGDIWTANEDGSDPHRVTDNLAREVYPRFSPDGKWIAYQSDKTGREEIYLRPFRGPGAEVRLD